MRGITLWPEANGIYRRYERPSYLCQSSSVFHPYIYIHHHGNGVMWHGPLFKWYITQRACDHNSKHGELQTIDKVFRKDEFPDKGRWRQKDPKGKLSKVDLTVEEINCPVGQFFLMHYIYYLTRSVEYQT